MIYSLNPLRDQDIIFKSSPFNLFKGIAFFSFSPFAELLLFRKRQDRFFVSDFSNLSRFVILFSFSRTSPFGCLHTIKRMLCYKRSSLRILTLQTASFFPFPLFSKTIFAAIPCSGSAASESTVSQLRAFSQSLSS